MFDTVPTRGKRAPAAPTGELLGMADVAEKPVIRHLSASAISDYLRCPLLWYGRRIAKWPQPPSLPMAVGTALHKAFEAHHSAGGDPELALIAAWAKHVTPLQQPASLEHALRALQAYRLANPAQDGDQSEVRFSLKTRQAPVPILGFIDLIRGNELHEHKTGRARWTQERVDLEFQATAYWWAFGALYKRVPERLVYHSINTQTLVVTSLETSRTLEQVALFLETVEQVYKDMLSGELVGKCPPSQCQFREQCARFPRGDE